jgi:hypothetical protein
MNWFEAGLIVVTVAAIVYGVRLYLYPAPWDDQDEDEE